MIMFYKIATLDSTEFANTHYQYISKGNDLGRLHVRVISPHLHLIVLFFSFMAFIFYNLYK